MTFSTTIWAALRKRETPEPTVPYVLRDLTIDYAARQATFAGNQVRLTAIEFRTLVELSANAGRVVTYMALQDLTMMLPSRLGCSLSLKTPNMGNPG